MSLVPFSHISALRCLIIDDMPAMRQNIRMHLGQLGVTKVDQAATPDESIRFVQAADYDLIICDYNLNKESNGQQLLEFFRTQHMLSPTSMFIMVTAESGYNLVASAAEFQPDAYMLKPLTASRIAERVDRLLEKQHAMLPVTEKMKRKDFAGAVIECDNVLKSAPKWSVEIMKTKGTLLIEQRRIDEAREVYAQALAMRDDLVWAKVGLARCNPLQNPYIAQAGTAQQEVLPPAAASDYLQRAPVKAGMAEDLVSVFYDHGFLIWGGNWKQPIDYQHFEIGSRAFIRQLTALPKPQARAEFERYVARYRSCAHKTDAAVMPAADDDAPENVTLRDSCAARLRK